LKAFTLVELVCTLVVIGVIASVALPRFFDLSDEAYDAAVLATARSLEAAVSFATAGCAVRGWQGRDNLPGYATGGVDFNSSCHPTDTGNANAIGGRAARCMRVWQTILAGAPSVQTGATGAADYRAVAAGEVCRFLFRRDTTPARQITYDASTGDVSDP
jgi:prepilin-type N-terminal cleavage/methylation domain-containing protein